ncbi:MULTISPECIES: SDR family NAD(P)-dependent oxidoreductase [unclassified Apibacter]|uniref:SDR family NAD(P)-dependent oxidoreductase n=1 Tax=unclassified Apibacter TaxID=2630820 RepID=UPI00132B7482|nr:MULTISPECIES: SDR family NAD(P)-dependent oxidoreductase [unclassified Apibacter]MCX8677437.1 SDR family NAD(P)-dependent oxidoreductase [Apibacter sp. B3919]MXO25434.1 SDR family NAD(P)-dependent oxidoreductase [Apibacter sp. B3924]MXO26912.1 SDR family NAD(P)-dependent oxidoreductase [Apibacter sp. B3813]MXO28518.1 SDR family NAD(P)-dependent oxidoreductase [Apibacter sp. B3913]MXO30472.1 SDR family NAD(P)-dependent oxidoreductase [Apibacter sp. B3912]
MQKTALITGATSGIGQATAKIFAEKGINLILCGRRKSRLDDIKKELEDKVKITTLSFDVGNREAVFSAIESLSDQNKKDINILVNCAGNAHGLDTFLDSSIDDFDSMIDSNVKGLLYVSKAVVPILVANKKGHIINISSIAGKETYPKGTVYCATKHAVEAISKGMRMDLLTQGIKVTNIAPGAVETEFSLVRFKGDQKRADSVYQGFEPLVAEDIADAIYYAVSRPDHVQIADMTIFPKAQASGTLFDRK